MTSLPAPRPGCACDNCTRAASLIVLRELYLAGRGPITRLAARIGIPYYEARRVAQAERWAALKRARQAEIRELARGRRAVEAAVRALQRGAGINRLAALEVVLAVAAELALTEAGPNTLEVI